MNKQKTALLTTLPLALWITGSIDSIRNLPGTALFGSTLIFFALLAALFFLLPTGFVSATLTHIDPRRGGIYQWSRRALGSRAAAFAIWLQWINTMVWFPSILSFIAGTAAYLIDPNLANNKLYLVAVILGVFWFLTLVNMRGLKTAAYFASWCTLFGMVIPMVGIIALAVIWLVKGAPTQIDFHVRHLFPSLQNRSNWVSLTAIMAAFLGMELATVHVTQTKNPRKTFPRALMISILIILVTMILGSLAIAIVIPPHKMNLVAGMMQTFHYYLAQYHLLVFEKLLVILILFGSVGGMVNWLISPAKGLMQAAQDQYLPIYFCQLNQHSVPSRLLVVQGVLVSLITSAFVLMPSINASYWWLTDLSTQLYMMMYILLFISAVILYWRHTSRPGATSIFPGGRGAFAVCCTMGILGCVASIIVGFFPPKTIDEGGALHYFTLMASGLVALSLPGFLLWLYQKRSQSS